MSFQHTCSHCGTEFEAYKSERTYCSRECKDDAHSEKMSGGSNPNWDGGSETLVCENCGAEHEYERREVSERGGSISYCSECKDEWWRDQMIGENHHDWDGGIWPDMAYSRLWRSRRLQALNRDCGRCVVCGVSDADHREGYGKGINVHHIRPRSEFYDEEENWFNADSAHAVDNLVTLCVEHHDQAERGRLDVQTEVSI